MTQCTTKLIVAKRSLDVALIPVLVSVVSTRVAKLRANDLCLSIESNRMNLPDVS